MSEAEVLARATTAALVSLVDSGVRPDVQELLTHGDGRGTVGPNALRKALEAAMLSAAHRDKALVEEGGLREALERARRLPVIVEEMIELEMLDREEDRPQLEQYRQDRIQTLRLIEAALSALSTKDMGLSRDPSQTADAATPKSAAPGEALYRGYRITYEPKPIPASCGVDWTYVHNDYDGPEDRRCGCAASAAACREEIDMLEGDQ